MCMKNKAKEDSFKIKPEVTLKVQDVIAMSIDKVGPKKVLDIILSQCLMNTLEKTAFPISVFANKEDEEKADVTAALHYLKQTWKESSNKGMKMLEQRVKEISEK